MEQTVERSPTYAIQQIRMTAAEGRQPNGSLVHITSIFGMTLAAQVIKASAKAQAVPNNAATPY